MPVKSLAELAESIQYGYTESATNEPIGPHFLRITDIVPPQINWDTVPYCKIDEKNKERFYLAPSDIVIARTGATVGYAKLIRNNPESVFASYLVRIRIDPNRANPEYIGRIVESNIYKNFVLSRVGGAAQPNANAKVLSAFCLPIPEHPIQSKIVAILSAYDELIENNRRRIQLLEQAARLLYKEWFIRLRFPGHEHVKIVNGVPVGWENTYFPEVIDVNPKVFIEKGRAVLYVPMSALSESGMTVDLVQTEQRTDYTSVKFKKNDVLLARITPCLENGKTGLAYFLNDDEPACGSTEFIVMRGKRISYAYTYCLARSYPFRENAIKSMIGSSGRQRVQVSSFSEYKVLLPPKNILAIFDEIVINSFDQIKILMAQNSRLARARDLLLPGLMNGEIAV